MRARAILTIAILGGLGGCTSAWISDPSPSTESLINDLKIEGFTCKARLSTIECRQVEPYIERSPKICSSAHGCVKQPCHDIRVVYEIRQGPSGIPGIKQTTEKEVTKKIIAGDLYSGDRLKALKDYCAIE